jgi:hypothetical protein
METLNKIYLELSTVVDARNKREIEAANILTKYLFDTTEKLEVEEKKEELDRDEGKLKELNDLWCRINFSLDSLLPETIN